MTSWWVSSYSAICLSCLGRWSQECKQNNASLVLRRLVFGGAPWQSLVVFNHPSSDPQPIQAASLEIYDYLQPRLYHIKSLPLYIPCHPMLSLSFLHQPGGVGQSSKRFAVNVGEGAMGSDREALTYEVPSNKSLSGIVCLSAHWSASLTKCWLWTDMFF